MVLNVVSDICFGGGAVAGTMGHEEEIFRLHQLFPSRLRQAVPTYPLTQSQCVYTPQVTAFMATDCEVLSSPFEVAIWRYLWH
jgi:hypothetical protein